MVSAQETAPVDSLPLPRLPAPVCRDVTPAPEGAGRMPASVRAAELAGAVTQTATLYRRASSVRVTRCGAEERLPWRIARLHEVGGVRLALLPIRLDGSANSAFPVDRDNGAAWGGRGYLAAASGGLALRWGPVSAAFTPLASTQQNRSYGHPAERRPGFEPEINPAHAGEIDWPYRPDSTSFSTFDPGQSYVRLDYAGAAVGVSTENLWWSPSVRNAILLGNSAPGFAHAFVGTSTPVATRIGGFDAELFWGQLEESESFDGDAGNDERMLAGVSASYTPRWVNGLTLGYARLSMTTIPQTGYSVADVLLIPYGRAHPLEGTPGGAGADHAMSSYSARWVHPESGFEVYGELARIRRDRQARDRADSLATSGHGVLGGIGKAIERDRGLLRFYLEAGDLSNAIDPVTGLTSATFYTDANIRQGYTHRGQLLGHPAGPGSNFQTLGADLFGGWGSAGVYVERIAYAEDAYLDLYAHRFGVHGHDVSLEAAGRYRWRRGAFDVEAEVATMQRRNRQFNFRTPEGLDRVLLERNWRGRLGLAWHGF